MTVRPPTFRRCDVDERWDGPPPRCDPVYCEEPPKVRHGGFSLSTNSTRFGTVASYYCTSGRHRLAGNPKLRCLPDGSWDVAPPMCRIRDSKDRSRGAGVERRKEGGEEEAVAGGGRPKVLPPVGGATRKPGGVDFTRIRDRGSGRPYLKTQRQPSSGAAIFF